MSKTTPTPDDMAEGVVNDPVSDQPRRVAIAKDPWIDWKERCFQLQLSLEHSRRMIQDRDRGIAELRARIVLLETRVPSVSTEDGTPTSKPDNLAKPAKKPTKARKSK